ncbi:MAG: 2Fe-2S iron-sulfur cluster binding domain-containing protein [Desulfovermiculus sp.]
MVLKVYFNQSGQEVEWNDKYGSLLELAQENNIPIESDCEQGFCGTCKMKLVEGSVDMEESSGLEDEDLETNMILPCVSVPRTDVNIEI